MKGGRGRGGGVTALEGPAWSAAWGVCFQFTAPFSIVSIAVSIPDSSAMS